MGINSDQVGGRVKEMVGKLQEKFGRLVGNKTEEWKGKVNKAAGAGQAKMGDLTEKTKSVNKKP